MARTGHSCTPVTRTIRPMRRSGTSSRLPCSFSLGRWIAPARDLWMWAAWPPTFAPLAAIAAEPGITHVSYRGRPGPGRPVEPAEIEAMLHPESVLATSR